MKPLTYNDVPLTLLEIVDSRAELPNIGSKSSLLHVRTWPDVSLGNNINITSLETYKINDNTDDLLLTSVFGLRTYDDNGTIYYKARGGSIAPEGVYYYKINGNKYSMPFVLCNYEFVLRFSHQSSLAFGLYNELCYDEIAFHTSQVKDNPQSSNHQVIKANGVPFISESYIHEYVEIKAYIPYYAVRKLFQAQFFDSLYLVKGSTPYELEKMNVEIGEGDIAREVTISILPKINVFHYQYKEEGTPITGLNPHFVQIQDTNGILSSNISGGSGNYNITWLNNGIIVGTGSSYNSMNVAGNYSVLVTDVNTGLSANDEYGIADVCANFSVTSEITNVPESNHKLITLTCNGTNPITYEWEYSENNISFSPLSVSSNILECENSGYYKYIVTDSNGCQKVDVKQIIIASHSVEINRNGNTLTATVTGCNSATLQWYLNSGNGSNVISGETSNDLLINENGLYSVIATCDGNEKSATKLILDIGGTAFHVLISKVWNNSGSQSAFAELINAPSGNISIEWYQRKSTGWVQIGSGDTININEVGFLKVLATDEYGNTVIDEMAQVTDPERLTLYNKFVISPSLENQFTISGFTVPNPAGLTENQINADWKATRGGVKLRFKNVTANLLNRDEFGIDYANNKIYISSTIKIYANEIIEFYNS